jgi:two-component system response regulator HydG
MRAADLDLREMLDFEPKGGVLRFAGERALIMDAVALGILRGELIRTFGLTAARAVLTSFGYAHGWRTAEAMKTAIPWDSERDWRTAGGKLHALKGEALVEPVVHDPADATKPFGEGILHDSYEAEQHLLVVGRSDTPVCWTLAGFASGYGSYSNGREIYYLEDRCRGKGDSVCRLIGNPREAWGPELDAHLPFFQTKGCLEAALATVTEALKAAEKKLRRRRTELARTGVDEADGKEGLVARSAAMKHVVDLSRRVSQVDVSVLVTGESGVGKERIARGIHDQSARVGKPFIAVNCGAITETLLESELFGHARGAFTGAAHDRPGLFESAQGGTLLLDEIGEVSPVMQVKLLRALQEREIRRVGENKNRPIDVRIIAATNRDLAREVEEGRFRKDLYYRLRVVEIHVPPLRERKDDILPLARALLADAGARLGRRVDGFAPAAADQLLRHDWPGNVRELENAIERAVALASGTRIELDDLPDEVRAALPAPLPGAGKVRSLDAIEREYILAVYAQNGGNQAKTADQLQIGTATLYRKLKQYRVTSARRARSRA